MSDLSTRALAVFFSVACMTACSDKSTSGGGGADASVVDGSRGGTDGGGSSDASSGSDGGSSYCSKDSECMMGQTCLAGAMPGGTTPFGCGAQPQDMCTTDGDCADGGGAAPDGGSIVCIAASGCQGSRCGAGCVADGECGTAQACKLGHCIVKPCTADMECPDNFSCQSNACAIKPCTQDADCKGYCVNAQCASAPGGCTTLEAVP